MMSKMLLPLLLRVPKTYLVWSYSLIPTKLAKKMPEMNVDPTLIGKLCQMKIESRKRSKNETVCLHCPHETVLFLRSGPVLLLSVFLPSFLSPQVPAQCLVLSKQLN